MSTIHYVSTFFCKLNLITQYYEPLKYFPIDRIKEPLRHNANIVGFEYVQYNVSDKALIIYLILFNKFRLNLQSNKNII